MWFLCHVECLNVLMLQHILQLLCFLPDSPLPFSGFYIFLTCFLVAETFHTLALEGVPVFGLHNRTAAYRFVTLVDVCALSCSFEYFSISCCIPFWLCISSSRRMISYICRSFLVYISLCFPVYICLCYLHINKQSSNKTRK